MIKSTMPFSEWVKCNKDNLLPKKEEKVEKKVEEKVGEKVE